MFPHFAYALSDSTPIFVSPEQFSGSEQKANMIDFFRPQFPLEVHRMNNISAALLPEFDAEMANTRKILEIVPDDKFDFKPHEKSMALGRLASHIGEMPNWASHTIQMDVLEMTPGQKPYLAANREQLVADFDKYVAEARALIAGASDEDLYKTWTFRYDGKDIMSLPRVAVLRGVVMNHMIHHRAQLGVYLRLNEVEIPGMYGPSADEMKFWQPQAAQTA
jgi:uncharacterized damage-inducible protein DinB